MNLFENLLNMYESDKRYSDEEMEILKMCYNSPTNEYSYLDFDEWLTQLEKEDNGQVLKDILYDESLNTQVITESNKSIDDLIEIAGGIEHIDDIFHEVVNEYENIENDINEVAEFTYNRIKGNLSLDEWTNVLEYLYFNSSKFIKNKMGVTESSKNRVYDKVAKEIKELKNKLKNEDIVENFGQNEVRQLKDKYDWFNLTELDQSERLKILRAIDAFDEWCMTRTPKNVKVESLSNNELWNKFSNIYNGFIAIRDLVNYFDLDKFGEFVQWCRKEADLDYDYEIRYSNWNRALKDLDEATGVAESISMTNIFNFFSTDELDEFWKWVVKEYDIDDGELEESIKLEEFTSRQTMIQELKDYNPDKEVLVDYIFSQLSDDIIKNLYNEFIEYMEFEPVEEATSGIGAGAYTTHAIDMIPVGIKNIKNKINSQTKKIKTESVIEFYGKEWSDEEIQKLVDFTKENPNAPGFVDPSKCATPFNYNNKTYYTVGEGEQITFDGKECMVFLTVDDELKKYLSYFEYSLYDDGDGENGPQELKMNISDVAYKVIEI